MTMGLDLQASALDANRLDAAIADAKEWMTKYQIEHELVKEAEAKQKKAEAEMHGARYQLTAERKRVQVLLDVLEFLVCRER